MRYLRLTLLVSAALALTAEATVVAMGTSACMQESQPSAYSVQAGAEATCRRSDCVDLDRSCQLPCSSCNLVSSGFAVSAKGADVRLRPTPRPQSPDTLPAHAAGLLRPPDDAQR